MLETAQPRSNHISMSIYFGLHSHNFMADSIPTYHLSEISSSVELNIIGRVLNTCITKSIAEASKTDQTDPNPSITMVFLHTSFAVDFQFYFYFFKLAFPIRTEPYKE